jgi:hypothetical protein
MMPSPTSTTSLTSERRLAAIGMELRRVRRRLTHSLLATVEAIFNLGTLGRNDTSATPMSDLFRGGIP